MGSVLSVVSPKVIVRGANNGCADWISGILLFQRFLQINSQDIQSHAGTNHTKLFSFDNYTSDLRKKDSLKFVEEPCGFLHKFEETFV